MARLLGIYAFCLLWLQQYVVVCVCIGIGQRVVINGTLCSTSGYSLQSQCFHTVAHGLQVFSAERKAGLLTWGQQWRSLQRECIPLLRDACWQLLAILLERTWMDKHVMHFFVAAFCSKVCMLPANLRTFTRTFLSMFEKLGMTACPCRNTATFEIDSLSKLDCFSRVASSPE